jgi:hypothetical protein
LGKVLRKSFNVKGLGKLENFNKMEKIRKMTKKQKIIEKTTRNLIKNGWRVFLEKNGEYGFYTDKAGNRVVSFSCSYDGIHLSGEYTTDDPKRTGSGWVINGLVGTEFDAKEAFDEYPPRWAVCGSRWSFSSVDDLLKSYTHSQYKEYKICKMCDNLLTIDFIDDECVCSCMK